MPDDLDLHALLRRQADSADPVPLDTEAVIRRSRRRRTPRVAAASGAFCLITLGLGVSGITALQSTVPAVTSSGGGPEGAADEAAPPADRGAAPQTEPVNPCGGALATATADPGISLTAVFPAEARPDDAEVSGEVVLTNTGDKRLTGSTPSVVTVTLSRDGTVYWHTSGVMVMSVTVIDLAPGESVRYPAAFTPARCADEATLESTPAERLPDLEPGVYQISAAIRFVPEAGDPRLVVGPPTDITLR